MQTITADLAHKFSSLALSHVQREYPNKLDHVINDAADLQSPKALHPVFYGSFDWHSCVHGYWLLAKLYRQFPGLPEGPRVRALFDAQFTAEKIAGEVAYLRQPNRGTFERPYGWGWLLMLAGELRRFDTAEGQRWSDAMTLLADAFVERFRTFLPKATYPIRTGTHFNTAFAFVLAFDYARAADDTALASMLRKKAVDWYGKDAACQAWEPNGDDFLSSALIEAECMRAALDPDAFGSWFAQFLPRLGEREPATLFTPATVSDRSDGKIAHLDGLNLSRAWCWRAIARALPVGDPRRVAAEEAATAHFDAGIAHVAGDYMGEHWMATYAVLAMSA